MRRLLLAPLAVLALALGWRGRGLVKSVGMRRLAEKIEANIQG